MTILSSSVKATMFCALFSAAAPSAVHALDYDVNTDSPGNNKFWSAPSTWEIAGSQPLTIPNGENDTVTFDNTERGIGLRLDLAAIELESLTATGSGSDTRGIFGHHLGEDPISHQSLTIGTLKHEGTGNLSFRNDSPNARLSVNVTTLISSGVVEVGHSGTSSNPDFSLEAFKVTGSSTISGTLRFNGIKQRVSGQNILELGALDLSGRLVLGGRGNTGGVARVISLTGNATGNIYVVGTVTAEEGSTGGTLEIDSAPSSAATYAGEIREHRNSTLAGVTLNVRKLGSGTQIFSRASGQIYTGGTEIEGGILAINNTSGSGLGTGKVTVSGTGTLAGNGRLELTAQPVEIKAGGTLAPGAHLPDDGATLTISGAQPPSGPLLSLEEGSTLFFRLETDDGHDRIAFTNWHEGGIELAAQGITIDASGVSAGRFNLFSFDTIDTDELTLLAAGFNAQALGSGFDGWQGTFGYTAGEENVLWLEVSVIPEPGSAVLTLLGLGALGWAARLRKQKKA